MRRWNIRDVISAAVIIFLVGMLTGQKVGDWRQRLAPTGQALAAEPPTASAANTPGELRQVSDAFARIAAKVTPAVVNISSTRIIRGQTYYDPFREFMLGNGMVREPDQKSQSLGSGVIVSSEGVVVTNNHNIAGADEVKVSLSDAREFAAAVVGRDPMSDVAVLQIDGKDLPVAQWGDSTSLRVGEWVIAVGNPFGFSQTVTAGIVSAKGRHDVGLSDFEEFIQTDAAINPGNSGGALVDINGKLVGINTAIFSKTGGYQGIGFAIPSDFARKTAEQIIRHGRVIRGWIGVIAGPLNNRIARQLGMSGTAGALVANLYRDQPAVKAGMQQFDVVTEVNGTKVTSPRDLRLAIAEAPIGQPVAITVLRKGSAVRLRPVVTEHPVQGDEPVPGI
ncbi:MAG: trypsin-like peptidase domain-containing protein [Armatimonadetes bacterium]|nr:trypsin-like peptidase domain-containing protein [Armatimonadota bacterium]